MTQNDTYTFVEETAEQIDALLKLAEDNGWNAAINACRQALLPEQSIKLRHLYRRPDAAAQ